MAKTDKKLIYLNYNAYLAENGKLYDTTYEEAAKEAGIYNEKYTYAPMAHIVDSGKLFPALEEAIAAADVGKEVEITIPSEDAAGARDPKLIEVYPVKEFYKQEINPYPGLEVTLGNRRGTVVTASAGRVRVDFNNPLAGHDLLYKFTVTEVVESDDAKAKAVFEMDFGTADGFDIQVREKKIVVIVSEMTKFSQEWPLARFRIVSDLRDIFGKDVIEFREVWATKAKDDREEKASE
jgi:FKBP-type peptidyl-prolyl cis-trans isomerase 2